MHVSLLMPGLSYTHLNVRRTIFEICTLPLCVWVYEVSKVNCGGEDDNGQRESHDDYVEVTQVMSLVTMSAPDTPSWCHNQGHNKCHSSPSGERASGKFIIDSQKGYTLAAGAWSLVSPCQRVL